MEIQDLDIRQQDVCGVYIEIIECMLRSLEGESPSRHGAELRRSLEPLKTDTKIMLKKIDAPLARFLASSLREANSADKQPRLRLIERAFNRARGQTVSANLSHLVLSRFLPASARTMWLPGCGDSSELGWLAKHYANAVFSCMDIDPEAIGATEKSAAFHQIKNVQALLCDLTKAEALPKTDPDVVLCINPFVIEHRAYQELMQVLVNPGVSDSRKHDYIGNLKISSAAAMIFQNLLGRSHRATIILATMDIAEATVIRNCFETHNRQLAVYRNPFAIKNLSSLLASKRIALMEPRIYSYILVSNPNS